MALVSQGSLIDDSIISSSRRAVCVGCAGNTSPLTLLYNAGQKTMHKADSWHHQRSFVSQILVRSKEATHTKNPMCTQRHRRETGTPGVIEQEWIKMARVALEKTFWPNDERIRNSPSAHHHFVQPQSACRRMDAEMSPLSKLQATAHLFDLLMRHVTLL